MATRDRHFQSEQVRTPRIGPDEGLVSPRRNGPWVILMGDGAVGEDVQELLLIAAPVIDHDDTYLGAILVLRFP